MRLYNNYIVLSKLHCELVVFFLYFGWRRGQLFTTLTTERLTVLTYSLYIHGFSNIASIIIFHCNIFSSLVAATILSKTFQSLLTIIITEILQA